MVYDIFLSYAREDAIRVRQLADLLEALGWSIWLDTLILPGQEFDKSIEQAIQDCQCVLVLWSRASVQKSWVKEEAQEARRLGKLVPTLIDNVELPLGFRTLQSISLVGFERDPDIPAFYELLGAVAKLCGEAPAILEGAPLNDSVRQARDRRATVVSSWSLPDGSLFPFMEYEVIEKPMPKCVGGRLVDEQSLPFMSAAVIEGICAVCRIRSGVVSAGFLIGTRFRDGRTQYLEISGFLPLDLGISNIHEVNLTHECWEDGIRRLENVYKEGVAGWYVSLPGAGVFVSSSVAQIHKGFFRPWHKLLVVDPVQDFLQMYNRDGQGFVAVDYCRLK